MEKDVDKFKELLDKNIGLSKGIGFCLSINDTINLMNKIETNNKELIKMFQEAKHE